MTAETSSYRNILKGMSIFGGVQAFQILINLVRGKFVAILLGPAGSGVTTLFTSASSSIQQLASLGLPMAMAREIAQHKDNPSTLDDTLRAGRYAIILTALLGVTICVGGAGLLSEITFGNSDFRWQFVLMALALGLTMLWSGDQAILQGLRQTRLLAHATLVSSLTGLFVGIPLYWQFGTDGIVPAMVAVALSVWIFYRHALHRSLGLRVAFDKNGVEWPIVRRMISFGILLMIGQLFSAIAVYLSNIYIRHTGTMSDLGCYQAATSICTQMASMIFAAMAMDYFPRLSADIHNGQEWQKTVNRQTELVVLLSAPITILLMTAAPLVVEILLTESYYATTQLLRWMGAAVFLQSVSYPMGYITFAKGNRKLYFWLEGIFANAVFLVSTCAGYFLWGITGLGAAAIARFAIDVAVYYIVNRHYYGFSYTGTCARLIAENFIYVAAAFTLSLYTGSLTCLVGGMLLAISTGWRSYRRIKLLIK